MLIFLYGCAATYTTVSFEILEPAVVSLPENVKQAGILNRAPISIDMFDPDDVENLTKEQLIIIDTIISNNILKSLNQRLVNAEVSAYHHPIWFSSRRFDTIGLGIPLTKREVNDLCREYGSDVIISLEYYRLNIELLMNWDQDLLINKYYETSCSVKWAIYLPDSPRPYNEYVSNDTLFKIIYSIDGNYYDSDDSVDKVREISVQSGLSYGNYLVPTWYTNNRKLYKGREKGLRQAIRLTNDGEWDSAYTIWSGLLVDEDSVLAAKAAYNMAIFYELEDNLDTALIFINQSYELDSTDLAEEYKDDLEVRILNREQLIRQIK